MGLTTCSASVRRSGSRWRDQRGMSLIELLVTVVITLIVLAGSFRAFDDARKATEVASLVADGNQNLRAVVVQITRDVMQTGRELPNAGIPVPTGTNSAAVRRPGPPDTNLTFPTTWGVLPSVCPGSGLGPTINNVATDLITVLYADPAIDLNQYPLTALASDGSTMTVDSRTAISGATNGIRPGDLIWFTNAVGNAVQTVTGVSGQVVQFASGSVNDEFGLLAALAGTVGIMLGAAWADPLATILVATIIVINALGLLRENAHFLLGRSAGPEFISRVEQAARSIDGVLGVHGIRAEYVGPTTVSVALHVGVRGTLPMAEADRLRRAVRDRVRERTGARYCVIQLQAIEKVTPASAVDG